MTNKQKKEGEMWRERNSKSAPEVIQLNKWIKQITKKENRKLKRSNEAMIF